MTDTEIDRVLHFWFDECTPEQWFTSDPGFDARIVDRFGALLGACAAGTHDGWAAEADGALALIVVLDQFSRNVYRGSAKAFAQDAKALSVAKEAIAAGFDAAQPMPRRMFFYMPFEHAEDLADQQLCVGYFEELGDEKLLHYAVAHRDVIARFGRFPHRNAILGRASTAEEAAFLETPGSSF